MNPCSRHTEHVIALRLHLCGYRMTSSAISIRVGPPSLCYSIAAFDTIDHSILLSRMESVLGVKGSALQWFKSYLLGRKQRIKINDDFSENQEILWSVPHGSVLGALLFLVYIIPLAQLIRSYVLNNHGYADDTQLCLSFKNTSDNLIV